MNKEDAIGIISRSAKLYKDNLLGKRFLFISDESGTIKEYEVNFYKRNFHHLTGTKLNGCTVNEFYNKAVHNRLKISDFEFAKDGTTPLKLEVLEQLMNINKCAKMIGKYNGPYVCLYTDTVAGTVTGCMGFTAEAESINVPNTALNMDIRTATGSAYGNIITIFYRLISNKADKYTNVSMCKKGIDIYSFPYPEKIKEKVLWTSLTVDYKK
jgi:hypothetical protein